MKTLSIRQPWAWLIIHGGKDIENRTWHTKFRGRFLVHAAQGMTKLEYKAASWYAAERGVTVPPFAELQRGGIIGSVELVDSVDSSESPWYMGEKGFVLRDPRPLQFMPMKGRLGFFEVPDELAVELIPVVRLYQPSNGTDGDSFISQWCCKCQRDKSLREGAPIDDCDDNERCDIVTNTMAFKVSDPEYPNEWRYQNGVPVCTAFVPAGEQTPRPRCEKTVDMFGEPTQPTVTAGPVTAGADRDTTGAIGQP